MDVLESFRRSRACTCAWPRARSKIRDCITPRKTQLHTRHVRLNNEASRCERCGTRGYSETVSAGFLADEKKSFPARRETRSIERSSEAARRGNAVVELKSARMRERVCPSLLFDLSLNVRLTDFRYLSCLISGGDAAVGRVISRERAGTLSNL